MKSDKQLKIRNSINDFLIFTRQNGEEGVAVQIAEENSVCRNFRQTAPAERRLLVLINSA